MVGLTVDGPNRVMYQSMYQGHEVGWGLTHSPNLRAGVEVNASSVKNIGPRVAKMVTSQYDILVKDEVEIE